MNSRLPSPARRAVRLAPRTAARAAARVGARVLLSLALFASALVGLPSRASAQRQLLDKPGGKGHLVFDQLSGFRASADGNLAYYGLVGLSIQSYALGDLGNVNGNALGELTRKTTTFFVAPSADYFVIDHLSVGAHLEFAYATGSDKVRINANTEQSFDRPNTTKFVLLPRVGYMFPLGDRFAIWPRLGLGYSSEQLVRGAGNTTVTERVGAGVFDLDVGFLYRFNEAVFVKLAPQLTVGFAGSRSTTFGNTTVSTDASMVQFSALAGVGAMIDLL